MLNAHKRTGLISIHPISSKVIFSM